MQPNQSLLVRESTRVKQSFLAGLEKKTLLWLAERTPAGINSDHLTVLGLAAMAGAGAGYWWSKTNPAGLAVVILCLTLNWLGGSLEDRKSTRLNSRHHNTPFSPFPFKKKQLPSTTIPPPL